MPRTRSPPILHGVVLALLMAVLDASVSIALVNRVDPYREAALSWYRSAIAKAEL